MKWGMRLAAGCALAICLSITVLGGGCDTKPEKTAPTRPSTPTLTLGEVAEPGTCELGKHKNQFAAGEPIGILYDNGGPFGMRSLAVQVIRPAGRQGRTKILNFKEFFVNVTHRSLCVMGEHITPAALGAGDLGTYEIRVQGNNRQLASLTFEVVLLELGRDAPGSSVELGIGDGLFGCVAVLEEDVGQLFGLLLGAFTKEFDQG